MRASDDSSCRIGYAQDEILPRARTIIGECVGTIFPVEEGIFLFVCLCVGGGNSSTILQAGIRTVSPERPPSPLDTDALAGLGEECCGHEG